MTEPTDDIELDFSGEKQAAAMTAAQAAPRMRELADNLERWNYEYYVLDRPNVHDTE